MKPYSEACEKNKAPILAVLKEIFIDCNLVLEIASGTGQHAVHFAHALPYLTWQTSEIKQNLAGVQSWLDEAQLPNLKAPLALNVNDASWSINAVDAVFNANTVHIISWVEVERLFAHIAYVIKPDGYVCLYGSFKYDGQFTSESNARFDNWLKVRDSESGVRDFEMVNHLAMAYGLTLLRDIEMPSNNRILLWQAKRTTNAMPPRVG